MPVGYTSRRSVQVSGFDDIGRLTPPCRLVSASCSSGQRFAFGFLQIRSHPRHPCRSANSSPCRARRGLPPPSECALPGAPIKKARTEPGFSVTPRWHAPKRAPPCAVRACCPSGRARRQPGSMRSWPQGQRGGRSRLLVAAFFAAGFFGRRLLRSSLLRRRLLGSGLLRRAAFLAAAFLPAFFAAPSSPGAFFAAAFLAGAAFFAGAAFLAGGLLRRRRLLGRGRLLRRAAFLAGAFFAGAFLAGAFFAVAITISLIKLQRAPRCSIQRGDSPPGGLPRP